MCLTVPREPPEVPAPLPWVGTAALLVQLAGSLPPGLDAGGNRDACVPMGSQAVVFIFLERRFKVFWQGVHAL